MRVRVYSDVNVCRILWILYSWVYWMHFVNLAPVQATIKDVTSVAGSRVRMACNITAPSPEDRVTLVLWYKGDVKVPIYTLDARKGPIEKSKHFPSTELGRRVHFDLHVKTPGLTIDPVEGDDQGLYRCRVEYRRYRTLSYLYQLSVIVPPSEAVIMDDQNQQLDDSIGPVDEGSNVTLICEAEGGSPSPSVTWWRDSVLLDDSYYITTQGYVRNEIILTSLRRGDLLAVYTCQAANNNQTAPTSNSVTLDLNLKPLDVRIMTSQRPLSAGKTVVLECESTGSRPRAQMSWYRGSQKVQTGNEVMSDNGNLTLSTLTFVPTADDHGKKFSCTAENPLLPNSVVEDSRTVTVYYVPELRLALGASIQHTAIKEGSDVYFDCNIRANPWVHDVSWRFGRTALISNTSAGIIVSNQSLVLQRVRKEHRGSYQCVALNSEGEGRSEEVNLDVQYAPVCRSEPGLVLGVAKFETANVSCNLEADPKNVDFKWTLNNTVESMDIQTFTVDGTTSTVYYTPRTMLGYGVLLCWGRNNIGKQKEPCAYRIVPVGPPESVRNCLVTNQTMESLLIVCDPGYDGGLVQSFHLEVYGSSDELLTSNISRAERPVFLVEDLPTGTQFILVVYAMNVKGKSNSVALMASTLLPAERRTAEETEQSLSPMIGILIGIIASLSVLTIVIAITIHCHIKKRNSSDELKQEKCDVPLHSYKEESIDSTIESPDVIPADTQVYTPDAKSIHMECTRRMNEEMYKLLKQKQGNYETLLPLNDPGHSEIVGDLHYRDLGFRGHTVPIRMESPSQYSDMYVHGGRTQVLPLPISDALDKRVPELPLINNVQQSTRDCIGGDRIVATTLL